MDDASKTSLATITHEGGLKFSAAVRDHVVRTDQPVGQGGDNSAVTPLELIAVALGSCIALYVAQFCQARGLTTTGLLVEVEQQTSKGPYRVARYHVNLTLPEGFPEEYRVAVERVARSCPAHNTLTRSPEIDIEVLNMSALPALAVSGR